MKKTILLLFTLVIAHSTFAQQEDELNEMISRSLQTFYDHEIQPDTSGSRDEGYVSNLYVLNYFYPQSFVFPQSVHERMINYDNMPQLIGKMKPPKRIYLITFKGVDLVDGQLIISFLQLYVGTSLEHDETTSPKRGLISALYGAVDFIYTYSCEKQAWEWAETKYR